MRTRTENIFVFYFRENHVQNRNRNKSRENEIFVGQEILPKFREPLFSENVSGFSTFAIIRIFVTN
jgi:hypothetical protein